MSDRTLVGCAWLSDDELREIDAFKRFLREVGNVPMPGVLRDHAGWIPYVLGQFFGASGGARLAPPEGCGGVPVTAWTVPG